jgi:hypothetical protein
MPAGSYAILSERIGMLRCRSLNWDRLDPPMQVVCSIHSMLRTVIRFASLFSATTTDSWEACTIEDQMQPRPCLQLQAAHEEELAQVLVYGVLPGTRLLRGLYPSNSLRMGMIELGRRHRHAFMKRKPTTARPRSTSSTF